jgi:hypothetical protein
MLIRNIHVINVERPNFGELNDELFSVGFFFKYFISPVSRKVRPEPQHD